MGEHDKKRRFSMPSFPSQEFQTLENPHRGASASPSLQNDTINYGVKTNNTIATTAARVPQELSDSFKLEHERMESFACVPEWKKEDADTLLGILNDVPHDDDPD